MVVVQDRRVSQLFDELVAHKNPQVLQRAKDILRQHEPSFRLDRVTDDEVLMKTAQVSLASTKSVCVCVFKGNTGKAKVSESLAGFIQNSIRLLSEEGGRIIVPIAGRSYSADAYFFKFNNVYTTYKVDGSTCTTLERLTAGTPTFSACINLAALALGKRAPYLVPNNEFGTHNEGW